MMFGIRTILGLTAVLALGQLLAPAIAIAAPDGYLDVKTIGAKGDGITDDSLIIVHSLSLAKSRGLKGIFFPPGTYAHSALISVTGGLSLLGAGSRTSVLLATGSPENLAIQIAGFNSSVSELGFTRQGSSISQANTCSGILSLTANVTIKHCSIGQGFRSGVYITGGSSAGTVSQNDFEVGTGGTGASITKIANGLTLTENHFVGVTENFGNGIELGKVAGISDQPVNNITITANRFDGVDNAVHGERSSNIVIERNVIMPGVINLHSAIGFAGGAGTANSSIDIRNNAIGALSDSRFESGIVFDGDSENSNVSIAGNEITGVNKDGIGLHGHSANFNVAQNKITGAGQIAVRVDASNDTHDITISRNVVQGRFSHLFTRGAIVIRGGKNFSINNNDISDIRGGNDGGTLSFGGGITMDANASSYGTCDITSNQIKDVDLSGSTSLPPLAVIQVNTSSSFDKLKIVDNRYTGNTNGLGYFILCPDETKVPSLIVVGNTTNTTLPTHLGP
jgi:hypothetical protein